MIPKRFNSETCLSNTYKQAEDDQITERETHPKETKQNTEEEDREAIEDWWYW